MTATAPPYRLLAGAVAAAGGVQVLGQRAVRLVGRDLVEHEHRHLATARGCRFVFADRHDRPLMRLRGSPATFPRAQRDVCLLPVGTAADKTALALQLAAGDRGADLGDLRAAGILDGAANVDLWRPWPPRTRWSCHRHEGAWSSSGDQRTANDFSEFHDYALSAASSSFHRGRGHHDLAGVGHVAGGDLVASATSVTRARLRTDS